MAISGERRQEETRGGGAPMRSILAAVSGGADSVALLHMLREEGFDLTAAHYNHGLRPEADEDETFVRKLCERFEIPLAAGRGDVAAEAARRGAGIEETAREMRYAFLEKTREERGLSNIATAHNADDNAETVLLNLVRGAGLAGLSGIPPVRERIVRPILHLSRDDILRYLVRHGLPHREDASNADKTFRRNFLRHEVIPALKALNPSLTGAVTRLTGLLREDEAYLLSLAREELRLYGGGAGFPAKRLNALPKPVASRVCRLLVLQVSSYPPELLHIEAMLDISAGGNGRRRDLPGGLTAAKSRGQLSVTKKHMGGEGT
ncbi:MAG: tRNA lysidine(34) synthetase TilS [Oscillospiraceae bacterium]|jgi:tRNA(Ile)-lysidine synthase|nr:tRNA lysidine(34) synthetase TilS [Oscillospiraceae bacterium]